LACQRSCTPEMLEIYSISLSPHGNYRGDVLPIISGQEQSLAQCPCVQSVDNYLLPSGLYCSPNPQSKRICRSSSLCSVVFLHAAVTQIVFVMAARAWMKKSSNHCPSDGGKREHRAPVNTGSSLADYSQKTFAEHFVKAHGGRWKPAARSPLSSSAETNTMCLFVKQNQNQPQTKQSLRFKALGL